MSSPYVALPLLPRVFINKKIVFLLSISTQQLMSVFNDPRGSHKHAKCSGTTFLLRHMTAIVVTLDPLIENF